VAQARSNRAPNWARRPVRLLDRLLTSRYGWTPFGLILAFYVAIQIHDGGSDLRRWDVLLISGWAVLVVGLVIAETIPQRAQRMLERMRDRGSLEVTQRELDDLWTDFAAGAGRWGLRTGWVTAAAVFLAFVLATHGNLALKATLVVLESIGAYVAGYHLGRMAGFGRLGPFLRARDCMPKVRPGHLDGVGGLKPVGDFYFFQAMVVAIPGAFIAVWWVLIVLGWNHHRYDRWKTSYPGLLAVAVVIEMLAFVVPLWAFHQEMVAQKDRALKEADRTAFEIAEIQAKLVHDPGSQDSGFKERIAAGSERYRAIEEMPTWPVDPATRRRFRLSNIALILPFVGQALGQTHPWQEISHILERLSR
jgi:hypothetical protein